MKKLPASILSLILLVVAFLIPVQAQASDSLLPETTSWTTVGMSEMFSVSGKLSTSLDGYSGSSGQIQVEKSAADSKVLGAYLTLAAFPGSSAVSNAPSDVLLNGLPVTFSHSAIASTPAVPSGSWNWGNHLADVTSIIKPTIDAAPIGVGNISIDLGANPSRVSGVSLFVLFEETSGDIGSVIFLFGTTDPDGATVTSGFSALTSEQLSGHTLSLGISHSFQGGTNPETASYQFTQSTSVSLSTSSAGPSILSEIAGGGNNALAGSTNDGGGLFTVGGVGDNLDLPGGSTWGIDTDDELYDISNFVAVGDTSLSINTRNASGDDNVFQAVISLAGVEVEGSVPVTTEAPTLSSPPVINGTAAPGQTLTVTDGTWSGQVNSLSYQWYDCPLSIIESVSTVPEGCTELSGQTSNTYIVTGNETHIVAFVTATNNAGSSMASALSVEPLIEEVEEGQPESEPVAVPYLGPIISSFSASTLHPCIATAVTFTGTNLLGAEPYIQGRKVTILETSDSKMVLAFPSGLRASEGEDLILVSEAGVLRVQNAFEISSEDCSVEVTKGRWTQLQSDGKTVKMYAKNPVGDGKLQFFVDGEELAWINAVDEADPKLSFASGNPYLVRSVELNPGKNRFEIRLDGVRIWRATYVPKG